uniref:ABC transporter ATP-binding protein n=1 Tax=Parastrongyloides trichosuri TaxID=131310 RepID=A0A0N4ZAP1_PARTI
MRLPVRRLERETRLAQMGEAVARVSRRQKDVAVRRAGNGGHLDRRPGAGRRHEDIGVDRESQFDVGAGLVLAGDRLHIDRQLRRTHQVHLSFRPAVAEIAHLHHLFAIGRDDGLHREDADVVFFRDQAADAVFVDPHPINFYLHRGRRRGGVAHGQSVAGSAS